mgnify:CR=1 FL=1
MCIRDRFTSIRDSIIFITNASLATEALLETAIDNLSAFLNEVVGDSTDFQQTLDGFATAVATANTNFDTALQAQPRLSHNIWNAVIGEHDVRKHATVQRSSA